MRSWVVPASDRLFRGLRYLSLFTIFRSFIPSLSTPGGVELWVASHTALAFAGVWLAGTWPQSPFVLALVIYGTLRILEVVVYQVNVLLFDHTGRHEEAAYGIMVPQLDGVTRSPPVLLSESFSTFTGSGWSQMTPRTQTALALMWVESAAGLFMSIVVLARFIAILPVPHSRTKGEKDIV